MSCFRAFLAFITGVVYVSGFGFLYHHRVLESLYAQTPDLWRPAEEMAKIGNWMFLATAVIVFAFLSLYSCHAKCASKKPCGIKFGLMAGLVMAAVYAGSYIYLPISENLAIAWVIGGVIEGVGLGIIFSAFACCQSSCKTACAPKQSGCCTPDQSCHTKDGQTAMVVPAPVAAPKKKAAAKKKTTATKKKPGPKPKKKAKK